METSPCEIEGRQLLHVGTAGRSYSATKKVENNLISDGMAAKRRIREWEQCGDGFSGLTTPENVKSSKRRCVNQSKNLSRQSLISYHDVESRSDKQLLEGSIAWSSSDDEASQDLTPVTARSRSCHTKPFRGLKADFVVSDTGSESSNQVDIDFVESDSESSQLDVTKTDVKVSDTEVSSTGQTEDIPGIQSEDSCPSVHSQTIGQKNLVSPKNSYSFSPSICASTSSQSQSESPSKGVKLKASEWVKMLDLKTPTKEGSSVSVGETEDSAKKKKRFKRGGFADQLQCLQSREKSSYSVWKHQQAGSKDKQSTSSKVMVVEVTHFELLCSLTLSHCTIISPVSRCGQHIKVIFSTFITDQLPVQVGSQIRISPPWQVLELRHNVESVLLCTRYCELIGQCRDLPEVKDVPSVTQRHVVWECPCVTGLVSDWKSCLANQHPCIPGLLTPEPSDDVSSVVTQEDDSDSMLHTVMATQTAPAVSTDSILDWIDMQNRKCNSDLSFVGLVQRVFCQRDEDMKRRYTLLVEDAQGAVCEVICPQSWDNSHEIITQGEGQCYMFSGLTVKCRTNRDRDPALFSVIDKVWSGGTSVKIESQDSEDKDQTCSLQKLQLLGFCYIMKEDNSLPEGFRMAQSHKEVTRYRGSEVMTLADITKTSLNGKSERASFFGKVIYKLNKDQMLEEEPCSQSTGDSTVESLLYVCDCSNDNSCQPYYMLKLSPSSCIENSISDPGTDLLFRDVLIDNGQFYYDMYSTYQTPENYRLTDTSKMLPGNTELKDIPSLAIDDLHITLPVMSLCQVTGTIIGVDEDSAYSWDVCDKCSNDKLAYRAGTSQLVCLNCKSPVHNPVTKMKLSVFIQCRGMQEDCSVKVELLQRSIERLLPPDMATDEGHEISSVLDKYIGPLKCVLLKHVKKIRSNPMLHLLEINLHGT